MQDESWRYIEAGSGEAERRGRLTVFVQHGLECPARNRDMAGHDERVPVVRFECDEVCIHGCELGLAVCYYS